MRIHATLLSLALPLLFVAAVPSTSFSQKAETKTLTTKDGVGVAISYYPSSAGKDATPVVMLHDLKESRAIYADFAKRLQEPRKGDRHASFAVVTVDLRGHGGSVTQTVGGATRQIEATKLSKADTAAMVLGDMEAVRKFLVSENDAGKLNLNRLSLVGTGLGASVAANWAARDWSMPPLAAVKQGQDVKVLIMVSPRWTQSGLSLKNPLRQVGLREKVATMIFYGGGDRRVSGDARRIYKQLERYHPDVESPEAGKLPTLVEYGPDTELQGSEWLKQAGRKAEDSMIRFITQHAVEPKFDYSERRSY